MDALQPVEILYPDIELTLTQAIRSLGLATHVGKTLPTTWGPANRATAITINRVGGRDPTALIQFRCHAPTDQQATDLARNLAARLPPLTRQGYGLVRFDQNVGPTDLGPDPDPMRQMMYDVTYRGRALTRP